MPPSRARRLAPGHFRALSAGGLRTPIGTDLVLHERPDPEAVRLDGKRLAAVVREAAERYRTSLAIPVMDLSVEKADLVHRLRPDVAETDTSLGSSRRLWEDAAVVPADVVLFGNLPTKHFYSDDTLPVGAVRARTRGLVARMRQTGHPFILGSECDVRHVPEAAATIRRKVDVMLTEDA